MPKLPLDEHEIKMMRAYLDKFPPLVSPPENMPYFDILRICATLESLQFEVNRLKKKYETDPWETLHDAMEGWEADR